MTEIGAISALGPTAANDASAQVTVARLPTESTAETVAEGQTSGFGAMLSESIASLDSKVAEADRMVTEFALDGNTPIHHVTVALEEARMAVELAAQVRLRLTEGYRTIMNMQL